jgi:hypothetical protein
MGKQDFVEVFLLGGGKHLKKCNLNMVFLHHSVCQGYWVDIKIPTNCG